MASLTIVCEGSSEEFLLEFVDSGQRMRLIELYLTVDKSTDPNESERESYELSYGYDDVVMLRNFLTTVIDLYDQKEKKKENEKGDK